MPRPDNARPAGLKRTRLYRANLKLSAQSLHLPGTCVGCSSTLRTKSCNGQEVVNNLLRLASVAELSVPEGMLNE